MRIAKDNSPTVAQVRAWKFTAIVLVALLLGMALFLYVSQDAIRSENRADALRLTEEMAATINANIDGLFHLSGNLATEVSSSGELTPNASKQDLQFIENNLLSRHSNMVAARLIPLGGAKIDISARPPFSFASLDTVTRSENLNIQIMEALPDIKNWLVTISTPVPRIKDRFAGTLYLYFDPVALTAGTEDSGYKGIEIVQFLDDGRQSPFFSRGEDHYEQLDSFEIPLKAAHWLLIAYNNSSSFPYVETSPLLLLMVFATFLLIISLKKAGRQPIYTSEIQENKKADETSLLHLKMKMSATGGVATYSHASIGHIFRANDIRGVVGEALTDELAQEIGLAFGSEAQKYGVKRLLVACDGRVSSPGLTIRLIAGIRLSGVEVVSMGDVPTPLLYFATSQSPVSSGVIVTGSHNPAEYNGFKMVLSHKPVMGDVIRKLLDRVVNKDYRSGSGGLSSLDTIPDYIRTMEDRIALERPIKAVLDCGNGIAGRVAPELFQKLGCTVVPLFCEVDGSFPNHPPDPTIPVNLEELIATVGKENADIGLAFDGDGDRVIAVTPQGQIIWPDQFLMLLAEDMLKRRKGGKVVFDVKCSSHLPQLISELRGEPVMTKSGHSYLKKSMEDSRAVLGGEFSGHICITDRWFRFDDGLYAGARLVELLSFDDLTLDDLLARLPKSHTTPEILIKLSEQRKFEVVEQFKKSVSNFKAEMTELDGVRLDFPTGWGLVRASNTSPAITMRFEAESRAELDRIKSFFRSHLQKIDSSIEF